MKIEIDPVRIIKETRLEKHVFMLSHGEMEFIVKHKALTAFEKLLWLMLASMSTEDDNFACEFCYETLASKMKVTHSLLVESVQNLKNMGFLELYSDARGVRCSISLPNAGLLYLRLASKKETPEWLKKMRHEEKREVFMWW
jgi:hypothetical protein